MLRALFVSGAILLSAAFATAAPTEEAAAAFATAAPTEEAAAAFATAAPTEEAAAATAAPAEEPTAPTPPPETPPCYPGEQTFVCFALVEAQDNRRPTDVVSASTAPAHLSEDNALILVRTTAGDTGGGCPLDIVARGGTPATYAGALVQDNGRILFGLFGGLFSSGTLAGDPLDTEAFRGVVEVSTSKIADGISMQGADFPRNLFQQGLDGTCGGRAFLIADKFLSGEIDEPNEYYRFALPKILKINSGVMEKLLSRARRESPTTGQRQLLSAVRHFVAQPAGQAVLRRRLEQIRENRARNGPGSSSTEISDEELVVEQIFSKPETGNLFLDNQVPEDLLSRERVSENLFSAPILDTPNLVWSRRIKSKNGEMEHEKYKIFGVTGGKKVLLAEQCFNAPLGLNCPSNSKRSFLSPLLGNYHPVPQWKISQRLAPTHAAIRGLAPARIPFVTRCKMGFLFFLHEGAACVLRKVSSWSPALCPRRLLSPKTKHWTPCNRRARACARNLEAVRSALELRRYNPVEEWVPPSRMLRALLGSTVGVGGEQANGENETLGSPPASTSFPQQDLPTFVAEKQSAPAGLRRRGAGERTTERTEEARSSEERRTESVEKPAMPAPFSPIPSARVEGVFLNTALVASMRSQMGAFYDDEIGEIQNLIETGQVPLGLVENDTWPAWLVEEKGVDEEQVGPRWFLGFGIKSQEAGTMQYHGRGVVQCRSHSMWDRCSAVMGGAGVLAVTWCSVHVTVYARVKGQESRVRNACWEKPSRHTRSRRTRPPPH